MPGRQRSCLTGGLAALRTSRQKLGHEQKSRNQVRCCGFVPLSSSERQSRQLCFAVAGPGSMAGACRECTPSRQRLANIDVFGLLRPYCLRKQLSFLQSLRSLHAGLGAFHLNLERVAQLLRKAGQSRPVLAVDHGFARLGGGQA